MREMLGDMNARSTRRDFLTTAAALAVPAVAGLSTRAEAASKKRNIIFILIDDQRYDAMSCMGHPFLETPNLDRLLRGGANFKNAFVTTSLCSPSRATILTGQYAHKHGVINNSTALPAGTVTFPMLLKDAGYETAFLGKWHMGRAGDIPQPGFDRWVSFGGQGVYYNPRFNADGEHVRKEGYVTDLITDYAVEFLEQPRERPFFLYVSHKAVHADFKPAVRHRDKCSEVALTMPASMADTEENYEGKPAWVRAARDSVVGVDGMYWGRMPYDKFIRDYNRTMLGIDENVGRLIDTLEKLGMLDSTLIVFASDNGFLQGEHGLIDKRNMYEESIRIPIIVHCPDIVREQLEVDQMVLNTDIGPTILDAAGVSVPHAMQGMSFMPLARGQTVPWRESFLYEYFWEEMFPENPTVFGVRTDRWKYMWYHGIDDKNELYDLKNDPHEMTNLIDDPDAKSARRDMEAALRQLMKEAEVNRVPSW